MTVRDRRHAIVLAHTESENAHDFGATVRTFARPRYEVAPTSEEHEGTSAVEDFLLETCRAFPDMHLEIRAIHHADDAVVVESTFSGTHLGAWRGLPPTGRVVRYAMCNVFVFEDDSLVCERLNFDMLTVLRQLGLADDPTSRRGRLFAVLCHPVVVGSAFARSWFGRSNP
jgi:steroid delta-isomerase-like uncharacterized protein